MACPVCNQRKPRRDCPAMNQTICSVCCGTKRLVEIQCPSTCPHLTSAREHPAAAVKRQQERDAAVLLPTIQHLSERQHQLLFFFLTTVGRYKPEGFTRLVDNDVAEAAAALAATLETSARGVIYEHTTQSLPAQRLMAEMKGLLDQIRQQGGRVPERETAAVLRAIESGVRAAQAGDGGDQAYLSLVNRLLLSYRAAPESDPAPAKAPSSLILP